MIAGEGAVVNWMPVLRQNPDVEQRHHCIDGFNNLVAVFNSECSAGAEIVLNINGNQGRLPDTG